MEDISLHVLDIVDNSIRAGAKNIAIHVTEDQEADILRLEISDDGEGMDENTMENVSDPFFTSKKNKRIGLGVPLLAQSARDAEGELVVESKPGGGTMLIATFKWSHPDRKPMGNLAETIRVLEFTHPEISFMYKYKNLSDIEKEEKE
jgi:signal transduction histidine kinase